ncbi:MAG: acetate--CoA ligase family protein [Candidatus Diapherotrites archaeon]|nr:acetate--CoA ligase family protein [Candidatus Diapherotrites archaeon]
MSTAIPAHEGFEILRRHDIPVAPYALVHEPFELSNVDFEFPWAMKLSSRNIVHKTEQKAVYTQVQSKQQALETLTALKKLDSHAPVVVQPMLDGTELFIGSTIDIQFGQTIVAGIGGVLVELFKDTQLRVLPIQLSDALDMLDDLKHPEILDGYRGKPSVNRRQFAAIIVKTAKMLEEEHFLELDLNPLIATKKGIFAVDARIVK